MKLSVEQVLTLLRAHCALDGLDTPIEVEVEGKQVQRIVKKPYKLSGKTRMILAKNVIVLTAIEQAYETVRKGLVKQFSDDGQSVSPDKVQAFVACIREAMETDHEVNLTKVTEADLLADDNPYPITLLFALAPLWSTEFSKLDKTKPNSPKKVSSAELQN